MVCITVGISDLLSLKDSYATIFLHDLSALKADYSINVNHVSNFSYLVKHMLF